MEHPFWRSRFRLEDPADLARILHAPIQEVWIDTAKGLDVAQDEPSCSREQVDTVIDAQLSGSRNWPSWVRAAARCLR